MTMLPDHFLLHPLRQMDLVSFPAKHLAKTIDFDIYAFFRSGGMKDMHVCLNDRFNYGSADTVYAEGDN
jgi:hypothetical protein